MKKTSKNYTLIKFLGLGWKSKIIFKRATAYISINKLIVNGCNLEKGVQVSSYLGEDNNGKKLVVTYLNNQENNVPPYTKV